MRLALNSINPTVGDIDGNAALITARLAEARKRNVDLAVFPELCLCGYPPRDLLEKKSFVRANLDSLDHLVATIRGIGVLCGF